MAQMLQAPIEGYEDAIVVPPINANNFELKQTLINLVQSNQFIRRQDPHNHLRFFNKVTSTFRHPEVLNTTIKLLLFPFYLEGEARTWLDKEPPCSILTWEDLVSKFINQFFPPSKTTYLRNEIIKFLQKPNETFNEAWERFKNLLRQCPHHDKLDIRMNRFEKSLNDIKAFVTSPAPIKAQEFQTSFEKKQDEFQNMMMNFMQNLHNNKALSLSSLPSNTILNPINEAKAITTRSGISYDGPPIPPPVIEKEPEATKDTELPSTENIQPPSVQVHEKDKESIDKPFVVPKTKTNLPYPSRLLLINLNSQRLNKEKQEVKNIVEQPAERRTCIIESLQNFRVIHKSSTSLKNTMGYENSNTTPKMESEELIKSGVEELIPILSENENFRVIHKSSTSLKNTSRISPVHAIAPILSTKGPEYSPSMGYENSNTTPKMESEEIIKSGVEELIPILSENEVTSEDKRECDMFVCKNSPICDDYYEIFFDSKNDNDEQSLTLKCGDTPSISYNNFESLNKFDLIDATCEEYSQEVLGFSDVVASGNPNPNYDPIISNSSPTLTPFDESDFLLHEEADAFIAIDDEPISPKFDATYYDLEKDILFLEALLNKIRLIENLLYDNSSPRPPKELNTVNANTIVKFIPSSLIPAQDNDSQWEEIDIVTNTDELLPLGFENDDSEEEIDDVDELHVKNSISNSKNELFDDEASDFDNPSFPRHPPEPPDADFKPDYGEEISVVMNINDKFECLNPRDEFDDDDYSSFMFVIYPKVFSFLLSAKSEDTIFDPGIFV
nr:reverse transcriptase domain-containing protein [Tanacetum cinerariifolium]